MVGQRLAGWRLVTVRLRWVTRPTSWRWPDPSRRRPSLMPAQHDDADIRMLASGVVYEDNWIRLRRDQIERRDGSRGTYAFVQKRDFALVIPAEDDGFHLVEEYRYPIGRRTWSFPQGGWPYGETGEPEELARLELALATGLEPGTPERESEEQDMRQAWMPRARFEEMIGAGLITDDSTVAAYALLLLRERAPSQGHGWTDIGS